MSEGIRKKMTVSLIHLTILTCRPEMLKILLEFASDDATIEKLIAAKVNINMADCDDMLYPEDQVSF